MCAKIADQMTARRRTLIGHGAIAVVSYLPLMFLSRGRLAADTRQAVYLDPGRFLSDALSMWDPSRDLGTVSHQNIVLVWPMGVFYWLADTAHIPLWLAQRVWIGSIVFLAGAGVLYLARTIGWRAPLGPIVAAFAYAMSPYVIQYGTRTSVLLLPFAALPWLIGLTARALQTGGWRHPALIALVTMSMAVNATALVLALLGPALWTAWVVWGTRDVASRAAVRCVGRIAVLGSVTSLWWVVALLIEGRYGLPLLSYTETIDQVASTSAAPEVLRGLGYWVPYLQEHDYSEVTAARLYLQNGKVMALQFGVVLLALVGAAVTRWRHRVFFAALVVIGVVIAIGAYPTTDPSPLSSVFHDFARSGGVGLALRSTTRAAPLALLGLAFLLGGLVDALHERRRSVALAVAAATVAVTVALAPAAVGRDLVDPLYSRAENVPGYWTDAIAAADANAGSGRILELPGTRFAAYRWGNTYEPITAGNARTPTAWREQIPYGGAGSADLLIALDNRIQEGRLDADALAPVARLMGVTELLVRNDLAYERYDTVAPDRLWALVSSGAPGLGSPIPFGPVGVNEPDPTHVRDDQPKPADPTATYPALALVPVQDSPGLVQVAPVGATVIVDGNGDGIVDAASAGVIDGRSPVFEAGAAASNTALLDDLVDRHVRIVLTDTNRRRVHRFRAIRDTTGVTLRVDQDPAADYGKDGGEAELDVFPDAGAAWQSVMVQRGAKVSATRYGNPLRYEAGTRPAVALDGDPTTTWQVGPILGGVGDALTIELDEPLTTDRLSLAAARFNTVLDAVDVRFDGAAPVRFDLDASARSAGGQMLRFPSRTFRTVSVELAATSTPDGLDPSSVGIAELGLFRADGTPIVVDETVRLPTALTDRLGAASADNPLSIVLTRLSGDVADPALFAEERTIAREFSLPTARSFSVTGTATSTTLTDPACRSDLVSIDGRPVPVRVERSTLTPCAPVDLAAGEHRIEAAVDQLVLSSPSAGTGDTLTTATVTGSSTTSADVQLAPSDERSWVVLAQSLNSGWHASGATTSSPVLLNGFGNAWIVDPSEQSRTIELRWTPQRLVNLALLMSLAGIATAVVLAVRGRRWAAGNVDVPALGLPWTTRVRFPPARTNAVALATGLVTVAVIGPVWGLAVAVVVGMAGRARRGHALLAGGALASIGAALALVLVDRNRHPLERPFDFFTGLHTPHRIVLFGLALVAALLLIERPPRSTPRPKATNRQRFALACLAGALAGLALFVWMLTAGTWRVFDTHPTSDFYDAQAHSLVSGDLDVPSSVLGIEAFASNGTTYMYQGPFPALLRTPVATMTDALDGRLAGVSMILAYCVAAAAISALLWRVRGLVRDDDHVGRAEAAATGGFVFACTGGSILVFEASQVSVYHESAMWGIALALAALWSLLRHLTTPSRWSLALTGALTAACLLSRASLGLGVVAAIGLTAVLAWRRDRRKALATLAACVLPVVLYCGINVAKFGTLVSVPWRQQTFSEVSTSRREFLDANDGTFFGIRFVPTTAVAYLRPDAFTIDRHFPWIGFRSGPIGERDGRGGAAFDKIDATASIPVSFPLLLVLGAFGAIVAARSRQFRRRVTPMTAPLVGAALAGATIFVFGFIAQRYLGDVLPFVALAATVGFAALMRPARRPAWRTGLMSVALVAIGVSAAWVTIAHGLWYQRVFTSPNDERATEEFYEWRGDLPSLPAGRTQPIEEGSHLPLRGGPGELFVLGDCAALYVADGAVTDELTHTNWKPVLRTPAAGEYDLEVRFPDGAAGTSDEVLVSGSNDTNVLSVEYVDDDTVRFRYKGAGIEGAGPEVDITPGRTHRMRVAADPETDFVTVILDDRIVFSGVYGADEVPRLGPFRGSLLDRSSTRDDCQELVGRNSNKN